MEGIRVLLADDDNGYLHALDSFLRVQAGIEVVGSATGGQEAVGAYERFDPSIVVMDAYMPGMDGIEATRTIMSNHPDARILMLTAHDSSELRKKSIEAGACGFVAKSQASRDLPDSIRRIARRTELPRSPDSNVGPVPEQT